MLARTLVLKGVDCEILEWLEREENEAFNRNVKNFSLIDEFKVEADSDIDSG